MVRQLELTEQSGLRVDNLYLRLVGNHQGATLANFRLDMPHSALLLDTIWASFSPARFKESLLIKGKVLPLHITPSDFAWLVPQVRDTREKAHISADFTGSLSRISIKDLDLRTHHNDIAIQANATVTFQGNSPIA